MLALGNYVQWKSRIKRYIDTKPNSELIHYCLQNPPYMYQWTEKTVPVAEGSSETTTERLKQGESINVQNLETNLYWEFGKFTSRDGESLESYYSRFYKMMNELVKNQCHVTNHQVNVQFLLQLQPECQRFVTLVKQSTSVVQKSGIQCYNYKEYGHVSRECQKPKRVKDAAYHKEKMLLCQQEEAGVTNTNDNYNVFAMENEHPEQPESSNHIYLAKQGDTKITIDSLDICYNRDQDDQDDTDDLDQERDLLASLIQKLKCEIDDNKNRNKILESSNKALVDKWKDLKKFQAELDKYNDVNYASKVEINCAKAKGDLMSYKIDFEKSSNAYTENKELNQMILDMTKELLHPSRKPSSIMITKQKSLRISFT
ncbi:retrovirus-related pol polyprotein from transposon TNT 1-94 [Tanacetum coccineum]